MRVPRVLCVFMFWSLGMEAYSYRLLEEIHGVSFKVTEKVVKNLKEHLLSNEKLSLVVELSVSESQSKSQALALYI